MAHALISQLYCGVDNRPILARVSRLWDYTDIKDDTKILHIDLLLVDEKGNSIHAQIYPPHIDKFKPLLVEGKVYYVDSFRVKNANRMYKPVRNQLMVTFTRWTTLNERIEVPAQFPSVVFSLTPFKDVQGLVEKNEYFIDVIGVIVEMSMPVTLHPKSRQSNSLKRNVRISDGSSTISVSLWGERATAFDADAIHKASKTGPQVVIFVGTLAKNYPNIGISLSGGSACKWYVNLDIPEVVALKQSIGTNYEVAKCVDVPSSAAEKNDAQEKTLQEIQDINPHKSKGLKFIVTATIDKISNSGSWWYNSCAICYKTSKPYGYTYRCTGCYNVAMPVPRYKIMLLASDDTATASFIMFGKIAQQLTKKPVEVLIDQNPPESNMIPDEITGLLEKKFVWNVSHTENAVNSNMLSLQVNSVVPCNEKEDLPLISTTPQTPCTTISTGSITPFGSPPSVTYIEMTKNTNVTHVISENESAQLGLSTPTSRYVMSHGAHHGSAITSDKGKAKVALLDPLVSPLLSGDITTIVRDKDITSDAATQSLDKVGEIKEIVNQSQPLSIGPSGSTKKRARTPRVSAASKKLFKEGDTEETHESSG